MVDQAKIQDLYPNSISELSTELGFNATAKEACAPTVVEANEIYIAAICITLIDTDVRHAAFVELKNSA